MTKFASRTDGIESLGPTGGPGLAPKTSEIFAAKAENTDTDLVLDSAIPDYPGAEKGLLGVKAPFSARQEGDIVDRLRAAGVIPSIYANDKFKV